ncbi:menaquinone biosynthesis protein [Salmonella enterica subsp. arizonae]|uniref:Menaquinone biosynthesis protein n=1 Tax=Salmonella enterica subsp. arizonae TaxID=59203 RepID=A0A379T807_SALER|nr:menaquinone biosynthesis protein [Salmonella enterica subsp. arizonae]
MKNPGLREARRRESDKQRDWFFWRQKRGVVVAGRMSAEEGKKVAQWAQTLGWPLIGDVLSQTGQPLPCADLWLGNAKAVTELQQAQIVVQLGSSLTGKRLLQWQATCEPEEYWVIDNIEGRLDPAHHRGRRLVAKIADWLELHPAEKRKPWCVEIPRLAELAWQRVVAQRDTFGEAQLAHRIRDYLPEQGQLFVGNSLVVRLIDALSQLPAGYPVYSNRGASGIDGLLSTAAGVQRASAKSTLAIVGDLSALYDLNALALLRQVSAPFVLIVVNNNGGQIFSLLPTPQSKRERFYLMPQNVHFDHAAAMFNLRYHRPENWEELELALASAWRTPATTLIELVVNETDGRADVAAASGAGKPSMMLHAQKMPGQSGMPWLVFPARFFLAIAASGSRSASSFTPVRGSILTYRDMADRRLSRSADLPMSSNYCALL